MRLPGAHRKGAIETFRATRSPLLSLNGFREPIAKVRLTQFGSDRHHRVNLLLRLPAAHRKGAIETWSEGTMPGRQCQHWLPEAHRKGAIETGFLFVSATMTFVFIAGFRKPIAKVRLKRPHQTSWCKSEDGPLGFRKPIAKVRLKLVRDSVTVKFGWDVASGSPSQRCD